MSDLRIYVACLASYNNGRLYGRWIDCEGKDSIELRDEVNELLRGSPYPNVEVECPDCEGFGRSVGYSHGQDPIQLPCVTCDGKGKVPSAEEFAIHDTEGFGSLVGSTRPWMTWRTSLRRLRTIPSTPCSSYAT